MHQYYQIVRIKLPKDFTGRKEYCRNLLEAIQTRFLRIQSAPGEAYFDDEGVHVTVPVSSLEFDLRVKNTPQILPLLMGHVLMSMMHTDVGVRLEIDILVGFVKRVDGAFKLAQVHLSQTPSDGDGVARSAFTLPQVTAPILTVGLSTPENTMSPIQVSNGSEAVAKLKAFFEEEGGYVLSDYVPSHRTVN